MSDIAIRVQNLSKRYRSGSRDEQPRGLAQAAYSACTVAWEMLTWIDGITMLLQRRVVH